MSDIRPMRLANFVLIVLVMGLFFLEYLSILEEEVHLILVALIGFFIIYSYTTNALKERIPFHPFLFGLFVFAFQLYFAEDMYQDLVLYIIVSEVLIFVLLVNYNWSRTKIYLGKTFQPEEIASIISGTTERVKAMNLDEGELISKIQVYNSLSRESLLDQKYLKKASPKGRGVIPTKHRSKEGNELLQEAKDLFYALLYGDDELNVNFARMDGELLTITMPRLKAYTLLPYMKSVTEIGSKGTWRDPGDLSNDVEADNVILEVEYRESDTELIGNAIKSTLRLINNLEVNEQILYFRILKIEQSSLV